MPVNHSLKIIFIHIPKTGGTSIEHALGMHGNFEKIGIEQNKAKSTNSTTLFGNGLQHLPATKIKKALGHEKFDSYFKFSVVRNPYERLVSYVAWLNGKWERKEVLSREEFSTFIRQSTRLFGLNLRRLPTPQYKFIIIKGKLAIDEILRYENIASDYACLQTKIGINLELESRMVSYHHHFRAYYSERELRIVNRYYQKDFDLLGYDIIT